MCYINYSHPCMSKMDSAEWLFFVVINIENVAGVEITEKINLFTIIFVD